MVNNAKLVLTSKITSDSMGNDSKIEKRKSCHETTKTSVLEAALKIK